MNIDNIYSLNSIFHRRQKKGYEDFLVAIKKSGSLSIRSKIPIFCSKIAITAPSSKCKFGSSFTILFT